MCVCGGGGGRGHRGWCILTPSRDAFMNWPIQAAVAVVVGELNVQTVVYSYPIYVACI